MTADRPDDFIDNRDDSLDHVAPSVGTEAAIAGGANVAVPASLDEEAHADADQAEGDANPV